jgi:hypothetical protein
MSQATRDHVGQRSGDGIAPGLGSSSYANHPDDTYGSGWTIELGHFHVFFATSAVQRDSWFPLLAALNGRSPLPTPEAPMRNPPWRPCLTSGSSYMGSERHHLDDLPQNLRLIAESHRKGQKNLWMKDYHKHLIVIVDNPDFLELGVLVAYVGDRKGQFSAWRTPIREALTKLVSMSRDFYLCGRQNNDLTTQQNRASKR